jgi:putrescine aminotransferase
MPKNKFKLIDYRETEKLSYSNVYKLYSKHVNESRVGLLSTFGSGRVLVDHALGSRIYLKDGRSILDLTGGFGVLNHGHNHPRILQARIWTQNKLKMEVNKAFLSPALAALSFNITQLLPESLQYAFFPNSGSEAIDVSLRLALKFHNYKRKKILYSDRAFHGKSLGPQSISRSGENPSTIPTLLDADFFKFNNLNSFRDKILDSLDEKGNSVIAAVIIEPFSASTMTECDLDFLHQVRNLCDSYNILLIFDEVYSGFYKTGPLFNFMRSKKLAPDILCFAKSLGGGKSSIAGVVYSKEINDKCLSGVDGANYLSSTYYGFYEECITAIEAIKIAIDENFEKKAQDIDKFMKKLSAKITKISEGELSLRGSGIFWGLFYEKDTKFTKALINLIPGKLKKDKNLALKIYLASAVNWLFEKRGVLSALSFGFNPHLIISLNFAFTETDKNFLERVLLELCEKKWPLFTPKFILNRIIKPKG